MSLFFAEQIWLVTHICLAVSGGPLGGGLLLNLTQLGERKARWGSAARAREEPRRVWRNPRQGSWIRAPFWSMGLLGTSWNPPGALLAASWGPPRPPKPLWSLAGAPKWLWGPPGALLGPPGASWAALGASWEPPGSLPGDVLASWCLPGASWGLLGGSGGLLGAFWGPAWGAPGTSL